MLFLLLLPFLLCSNIAIIKMVVGVNEMCVFGSVKAEKFPATFSHTILMPFLCSSVRVCLARMKIITAMENVLASFCMLRYNKHTSPALENSSAMECFMDLT